MIKIIQDIEKNANEFIRVELSEFKGHDLLSLRVYIDRDGTNPMPTKKGITVNQKLIPDLIEALQKAQDTVKNSALFGNTSTHIGGDD